MTPAEERRQQNAFIVQRAIKLFAKQCDINHQSAAEILGVNRVTFGEWMAGRGLKKRCVVERVLTKLEALGGTVKARPNYRCMKDGCEKDFDRESAGGLYCPTHAYQAAHPKPVNPEDSKVGKKYAEIAKLNQLGYSDSKAIRLAGYEGKLTRQAVSLHRIKQREKARQGNDAPSPGADLPQARRRS